MKKKKVGKMFVRAFFKSFIYICVFGIISVVSYMATIYYYQNIGVVGNDLNLFSIINDIESDGKIEETSKNLILVKNEETEQIRYILIEIFNNKTGNLDYITVPKNLEFTMSYELYKKMASVNSDIPQIIRLGKLNKYFQGEGISQCAQILLEDLLDISFSYYTVISTDVFKEMFEKEKGSGIEVWTKPYQEQMESLSTQKEYEKFFEKYYQKVTSNLSYSNKCTYISGYLSGGPRQVAFYKVSGENEGKAFIISVEETNSLIHELLSNPAYTEEQERVQEDEAISSVGLSIEILNSTKINGLASSFQSKLVEQGMNVVRVGNYEGKTMENTKIIVKKKGVGEDLKGNFVGAEIEEGELSKDIDIRIILGTKDGK